MSVLLKSGAIFWLHLVLSHHSSQNHAVVLLSQEWRLSLPLRVRWKYAQKQILFLFYATGTLLSEQANSFSSLVEKAYHEGSSNRTKRVITKDRFKTKKILQFLLKARTELKFQHYWWRTWKDLPPDKPENLTFQHFILLTVRRSSV